MEDSPIRPKISELLARVDEQSFVEAITASAHDYAKEKGLSVIDNSFSKIDKAISRARALLLAKNEEYAASDIDRLGNFRRQATSLQLPMSTAWGFLAGKHWDAVCTYINDFRAGKERARTQPIEDRIDDLIVYLLLLLLIVSEEKGD